MDLMENQRYIRSLAKLRLEELAGKTVVITGATGMIGSCLVDALSVWNRGQTAPCHGQTHIAQADQGQEGLGLIEQPTQDHQDNLGGQGGQGQDQGLATDLPPVGLGPEGLFGQDRGPDGFKIIDRVHPPAPPSAWFWPCSAGISPSQGGCPAPGRWCLRPCLQSSTE